MESNAMATRSGCPFLDQHAIADPGPMPGDHPVAGREDPMWAEARAFLELYHREKQIPDRLEGRFDAVRREIERTGSYWHTEDELAHGARVAWRNSVRCIGRLYWESLRLRDMRHLTSEEEVFESCVEHLREAYNGGRIRAMITVFAPAATGRPGMRIWNPQLIRYAGYRHADGSVTGDPLNCALTEALRGLGWPGGPGTQFDVLPLAIQFPGKPPRLFELPADAVVEVPIVHPSFGWFAGLGLKWHAVPALCGMRLEIGGVNYTAVPFNGWYMGTEIGARNFGDQARYNVLPRVAKGMGLDTRSKRSLWIDRALVEMNVAVNYSFERAGVTLIDHHTAAQHFMRHVEREEKARRPVTGQWSWLVPPMSGSTTQLYNCKFTNKIIKPNFFAQEEPWT
jgi:nitric-oxide synthase